MKNFNIRKYLGIPDLILIILLIAVPAVMLSRNIVSARQNDSAQLAVYVNGELYGRYDLDVPATIEIGNTNTLEISDGKARMVRADCPDQVCVHTAAIGADYPGHIVCLPNGIVVSVENADNALEIDGYVS